MNLLRRMTDKTPPDSANGSPKERRIWRRIQTLSTHRLLDYIDEAGAGMNRGYDDFRKDGDVRSLDEILDALLALKVITEELKIRCEIET